MNSSDRRDKGRIAMIKFLLLFCLPMISFATLAYENEPTGFRGHNWGESLSSFQIPSNSETGRVFSIPRVNRVAVFSQMMLEPRSNYFSKVGGYQEGDRIVLSDVMNVDVDLLEINPLEEFSRLDDKQEVGGVQTSFPIYLFHKSRLIAVLIKYYPIRNSAYPNQNGAKYLVPKALKRQYGEPTEATGFIEELSSKRSLTKYLGDVTSITNYFSDIGYLVFVSTPDWSEYLKESTAMLEERKRKNRREQDVVEKAKKAKSAEPDF